MSGPDRINYADVPDAPEAAPPPQELLSAQTHWSYEALVAAAQAGDEEAFAALRERLSPATARLADWYAPVGHKQRVAQEIWREARARLHTLGEPRLFRSWLFCLGRSLSEQARGG